MKAAAVAALAGHPAPAAPAPLERAHEPEPQPQLASQDAALAEALRCSRVEAEQRAVKGVSRSKTQHTNLLSSTPDEVALAIAIACSLLSGKRAGAEMEPEPERPNVFTDMPDEVAVAIARFLGED